MSLDRPIEIALRLVIGENWGNWGYNRGKALSDFDPQRTCFEFSGPERLYKVSSNSIQNCDRRSDDRQTDRQTPAIL